jgi:hypothetical protein
MHHDQEWEAASASAFLTNVAGSLMDADAPCWCFSRNNALPGKLSFDQNDPFGGNLR